MDDQKEPELWLFLIPSSDDPPINAREYQVELKAFIASLHSHGIESSSRMRFMDSATGGAFNLGEFGIIAKSVSPVFTGLIGAWLHAKYGRKVKLKFKDIEIEASSVEEAEKLIKLAEEHRKIGRK